MLQVALGLIVAWLGSAQDVQEPPPQTWPRELHAAIQNLLPEGSPSVGLDFGPIIGVPNHPEGFRVQSDGKNLLIQASTWPGLAAGAARALQLVDDQGVAQSVTLTDAPEAEWRGLMIDVARFPHTAQDVEDAIQLAWLTGLNRVHLHLTDDQLFTFPSKAFPELASWGPEGDRRHFTREELDHLVRYADVRGIQLVPEVDMPAHAGVMARARPDLFGTIDPKTGEARSTGVVNMANEQAYESLDVLIGEVIEVFWNSDYVHLGADEVYAGHLRELPEYAAYCEKYKLPQAAKGDLGELYCHFVARTCEMVRKRGKRPVVWEGFPGAGTEAAPIPNDILIMAWNLTYQSPESLINHGFEIVNCGWDPLYVVPSQCWAATLPRALDWNMREVRQRLGGREVTLPDEAPVLGAQVCVWEQRPEAILPSSYEVVAAVGSRMWNSDGAVAEEEHRANRAGLDRVVRRAFSPKPGLQANLKRPVPRYSWAELAPARTVESEQAAYDWRAAWPIPLGTGEVLDVEALGVRASGTKPRSTIERARIVNHELFSRVAERGHVDTRFRADAVSGLEWLPRRHWQPMAIELTGQIQLPESGEWRFFVRGRDGAAELTLGGAHVATSRGNRQTVGAAELPAGHANFRVRFHFEYVQNELNLMAQGPGMNAPVPFDDLVVVGKSSRSDAPLDFSAIEFIDPSQVIVRSLATGKPITSTAGHQGPNIPANAVDGRLGNESGWHCGESPASLTIDLEGEYPINRVQLFPYHDGSRHYQYRVEASLDRAAWTTVADASANTTRSSADGHEHRFGVTPARYVRVTMLKNSANPGVHMNEILVYADGAAPPEDGQ